MTHGAQGRDAALRRPRRVNTLVAARDLAPPQRRLDIAARCPYHRDVEIAIERLVALCCLVIGLSHIVQPRAWAELFIQWREKGTPGVFYTALLHFTFGAVIVAFHNVWRGIPIIVTLLGWGWTVKGFVYLVYPAHGMRMLNRVSV